MGQIWLVRWLANGSGHTNIVAALGNRPCPALCRVPPPTPCHSHQSRVKHTPNTPHIRNKPDPKTTQTRNLHRTCTELATDLRRTCGRLADNLRTTCEKLASLLVSKRTILGRAAGYRQHAHRMAKAGADKIAYQEAPSMEQGWQALRGSGGRVPLPWPYIGGGTNNTATRLPAAPLYLMAWKCDRKTRNNRHR